MFVYGLFYLWSADAQREKAVLILLGFSVFGFVVIQEFIEDQVVWGPWRALRSAIEEGSELLGIIILLKASISNTVSASHHNHTEGHATLDAICLLRFPVSMVGFALAPVLAYLTMYLSDSGRGHPADWLAAAIFLLAGLAAIRPHLKHNKDIGWKESALMVCCVLASVICVAIDISDSVNLSLATLNLRMFSIFWISLLMVAIWIMGSRNMARNIRLELLMIVMLATIALIPASMLLLYLLQIWIGSLVYHLHSHQHCPNGQ
jgi:hypothetical protein